MKYIKVFFILLVVVELSCSSEKIENENADTGHDKSFKCSSIEDCSTKETKEKVCVKNGCVPVGDASKIVHIVFYPKYISSIVMDISSLKYFYFYPIDIAGNNISCEQLLNNYDFNNKPEFNIIQEYEKQAKISSTGSEMYTLPLPTIKDSLIFFIFYDDKGSVLALGCAGGIDTTSNDSVGIFPCRPDQINACLGQF